MGCWCWQWHWQRQWEFSEPSESNKPGNISIENVMKSMLCGVVGIGTGNGIGNGNGNFPLKIYWVQGSLPSPFLPACVFVVPGLHSVHCFFFSL